LTAIERLANASLNVGASISSKLAISGSPFI
jgi:hypothetical protein